MKTKLDVLIPTFERPFALGITLTALCSQTFKDFRVIISDQTEKRDPFAKPEIASVLRILRSKGHQVSTLKHLPKQGLAEQRQFLLDQVNAPYCLFLDNDLYLDPDMIERLLKLIEAEQCGFIGAAPIGLSYIEDIRPHQQGIEFWEGRVMPEKIKVGSTEWKRHYLHNAANIFHLQKKAGITPQSQRKYKIAWVGGCVMFDVNKLKSIGGYGFWKDLPVKHCGEDVLVQMRVMEKYGGCGLIPSGVYHLELPTTVRSRRINAPEFFVS
jgi:glycosyltransferase involved in cell wall biosynthesis